MAEWRARGRDKERAKQHHCKWCGKKLRRNFEFEYAKTTDLKFPGGASYDMHPTGEYHYGEENLFCGLRCGYMFGSQQAAYLYQVERSKVYKVGEEAGVKMPKSKLFHREKKVSLELDDDA